MRHIVAMGEALIDFLPEQKGLGLKDVQSFKKMPGGAPANVTVCAAKLGIKSYFMGMVGKDGFGDFLIQTLKYEHVDTSLMKQTKKAKTGLAFVSLTNEGERDFIFYRDPSADQLFDVSDVNLDILNHAIFHFCSVSLKDFPIKDAHLYAIREAKKRNAFISFDPNIRLALWEDHEAYKKVIQAFLPFSDLLKVSDDELGFITGEEDAEKAIAYLLDLGVKYVVLTKGKHGVSLFTQRYHIHKDGYQVHVVDTTGAGDAWIGAFLSELARYEPHKDEEKEVFLRYLEKANAVAALTTTKLGAISALPTKEAVEAFMNTQK
ncbi:MAG: carbohydrate kinase [Tenericutes bacterium HGW-Tenericutes-6]|nr:MAG: carbohydrate kinase [Tenericutes bacterium HGW-Tenericutes-6]